MKQLLSALTVIACATAATWAATRGPDIAGYVATDAAVFSFVDIAGGSGGASVLAGTDDGTAPLAIPFPFQFYGRAYSFVCASTNGAIYFVTDTAACAAVSNDFANVDITAAGVPGDLPALLPLWTDLTFHVAGAGALFYQTLGEAGHRQFVVQWNNAYPQGSPNPVTFQVILTEGTNEIAFQYKKVGLGGGNPATNGAQATVGIRNTSGFQNQQQIPWSYSVPVLADSTAIVFSGERTPPVITARVNPATLWPPNGKTVRVVVSGLITPSTGLDPAGGSYTVADSFGQVELSGRFTVAGDGSYSFPVGLISSNHPPKLVGRNDKGGGKPQLRTYTIAVSVRDIHGEAATQTVRVTVPVNGR